MELQPGDKFGRLTIIRKDGVHHKPCGTTESKYLCVCDCGNRVSVLAHNLRSGNTRSCGCQSKDAHRRSMQPNHGGVINQIILGYKRHARDRGLEWALKPEEVGQLISSPCFYCGAEKSNRMVTKNCLEGFEYNGIDRVDSANGYTIDNVVACCRQCNYAKRDMSQKQFVTWLQRAAERTKPLAQQWADEINK